MYEVDCPSEARRAEIQLWCKQQFGPPGRRWVCHHTSQIKVAFFFYNDEDKTFFILRWS